MFVYYNINNYTNLGFILFKRLFNAVRSGSVTNEQWDDIRSNLISADLGVKLVDQVIAEAKIAKPEDAKQSITDVIQQWLSSKDRTISKNSDRVSTILVVGVNGTGKTTSTAKLANLIKNERKSVLLAAADTFRAAAVDQLQTWANRIDIEVVSGAANGDPAAVAFSAITKLERISKPGLRKYCSSSDLPRVLNGLGVAVISTSKGLMTDKEAKLNKVGGEVLCFVY